MKRILMAIAALTVFATSAMPASALNPQPLPPKVFKKSDWVVKSNLKYVIKYRYVR